MDHRTLHACARKIQVDLYRARKPIVLFVGCDNYSKIPLEWRQCISEIVVGSHSDSNSRAYYERSLDTMKEIRTVLDKLRLNPHAIQQKMAEVVIPDDEIALVRIPGRALVDTRDRIRWAGDESVVDNLLLDALDRAAYELSILLSKTRILLDAWIEVQSPNDAQLESFLKVKECEAVHRALLDHWDYFVGILYAWFIIRLPELAKWKSSTPQ
jgi:hypothetical protein